MVDRVISNYTSLEEVPSDFKGIAKIANPNYIATVTADGASRHTVGQSTLITNRPSASLVGTGIWQIGIDTYISNGNVWTTSSQSSVTPSTYQADKTGVTDSTAAMISFFNKAIADGMGHIEKGTYLISEGAIVLDNNHIETLFPIITTEIGVIFKFAGVADAPLVTIRNGTYVSGEASYWRGGFLGSIKFLDTTSAVAPNRHGLMLRGMYSTKFRQMVGVGVRGDIIHLEQKLLGGVNPDPYAVADIEFEKIEGQGCVGWMLNNDNFVGFTACKIKTLLCGDGSLGVIRGFGSGNSIDRVSVGNTSGWGFYDTTNTGGSVNRLRIGICEFDNVENGISANHISQFDIDIIRFVHRYNVFPNTSLNYWPREAISFGAVGAGSSVVAGKLKVIHRIDAGGIIGDLGTLVNFNNSSNVGDILIDTQIVDNAGFGIPDSMLYTNLSTIVSGIRILNMGRTVIDTTKYVGGVLSMSTAVTIGNSGFGTATSKIPYTTEIYDSNSYADPTNNWFTIPLTGIYSLEVDINLASPIGTWIRMGFATDVGGVLTGRAYRSYYAVNSAVTSYSLHSKVKLNAGDRLFFMASQNTAAPIALSTILSATENSWSITLIS